MIEAFLIEEVLSSLFDYLKKKVAATPSEKSKFDFIIKDKDGKKVAIEVKGQNFSTRSLHNIVVALQENQDLNDFYLITPDEPNSERLKAFNQIFKDSKVNANWESINKYLESQDLDFKLSDDIRPSLLNLQVAALTSKYESYDKKFIGQNLSDNDLSKNLKQNIKNAKEGKIDKYDVRFGLRRQFPDSAIFNLENDEEKISDALNFGKKYDDAIIILTDIKNFSSLVSVADPEELNELMGKYYTNARELVFEYGGVLDKFIGDAVLCIFNYPVKNDSAFKKATKFCAELILMGENILNEFQKKLDQEIETGTRVGLATGPIYALNIGKDDIEVTFIGDKINFAARLEKNCQVNGILLSNRFYHKLDDADPNFLKSFNLSEVKIDPKDAKGQIGTTTAWQVTKDELKTIIDD